MSDHFVFIPSVELSLDGEAKVTTLKVETPEYIAKQLMLQEDMKELLFSGKFDAEAYLEAAADMPILVADADVMAKGFELAGWCGSDGKPIFPIEPEEGPGIDPGNPGWGPCFVEAEMAVELGYL